jgi:hypothetical protein
MPVPTKKIEPRLLHLMACHPTLAHTILHAAQPNTLPRSATSYRELSLLCSARQGLRRTGGRT